MCSAPGSDFLLTLGVARSLSGYAGGAAPLLRRQTSHAGKKLRLDATAMDTNGMGSIVPNAGGRAFGHGN